MARVHDSDISRNAGRLIDKAIDMANESHTPDPGLNHWILAALMEFGGVVTKLTSASYAEEIKGRAKEVLQQGEWGEPLPVQQVLDKARVNAAGRNETKAEVRDVIAAVLERLRAREQLESEGAGLDGAGRSADGRSKEEGVRPKPTPTIDKHGRDLTAEAREDKLRPIVGREHELKTLFEVLCRTVKRNPLLIGPPGCGKTAIAEEVARQIAAGQAPGLFAEARVVAIEASALVAGSNSRAELERVVRDILEEASQPNVILFVDEAHALMNAGGGSSNLADALKPALARGEMALVAATTDDEYRRLIKPDGALARRFQPIPVPEMSASQTLPILRNQRDYLRTLRGVNAPDPMLERLLSFAEENMRNRNFPDKALDLLEQTVAYAVAAGKKRVQSSDVSEVLDRLMGRIFSPGEAVARLSAGLEESGLARGIPVDRIVRRLNATLRGLDVRNWRPNLVMAFAGPAGDRSELIGRVFARALYGSDERVLDLDVSQIKDEEAITILIGSPPAYVGYDRALPIHALGTTPGTVVRVSGLDQCHPSAARTVAEAIACGYFRDAMGGRYYLSDAVVLLVGGADEAAQRRGPVGFVSAAQSAGRTMPDDGDPGLLFGPAFAGEVDIGIAEIGPADEADHGRWVVRGILDGVAERYQRKNIRLEVDDSAFEHLVGLWDGSSNQSGFERSVEEWVSEAVLKCRGLCTSKQHSVGMITVVDGRLRARKVGAARHAPETPTAAEPAEKAAEAAP